MATTYTDQQAAIDLITNSNITSTGGGAITGAVHRFNEIEQNLTMFTNLVAYDNYNYKVVRTNGIPNDNGQELRDAYADAATVTGLSATNRFAILLPPGTYALGASGLDVDTEYIDIIGLGQAADVVITSVSDTNTGSGTIIQTADNVRYKNLTITNAASTNTGGDFDDSGYAPAGAASNTVMEDIIFLTEDGGAPFMRRAVEYAGTYTRCKGVDQTIAGYISVMFPYATGTFTDCDTNTFGFGVSLPANGVFNRCSAKESSFGSGGGDCDGTFTDCVVEMGGSFGYLTDNVRGKFYNCRAADTSFGGSFGNAVYVGCISGNNSFGQAGQTLAGTYENCIAGDNSFGSAFSILSGSFKNCSAGNSSFGSVRGTTLSGSFMSCSAGNDSFGNSVAIADPTLISGYFSDCRSGNNSFGTLYAQITDDARFYDCVGGNSCWSVAATGFPSGVQMYNCRAETGMNFSTTIDAVIKNCVALRGGFLNGSAGVMAGTYIDCYTENGFGVSSPGAITLSGVFKNCNTIGSGFGSGSDDATLSGEFIQCSSQANSFGFSNGASSAVLLSGKFIDCTAGDDSFGCSNGGAATVSFTGSAYNCKAGDNSFCTTLQSIPTGNSEVIGSGAILQDCRAGDNSFAGRLSGEKRGSFIRCYCINSDADSGPLFGPTGYMEDCTWIANGAGKSAIRIEDDDARIYGGIYKGGAGATVSIVPNPIATPYDASIAAIKMNAPIDPIITNDALAGTIDAANNFEYTGL